jgi:predicted PurR-regulated permease PerM
LRRSRDGEKNTVRETARRAFVAAVVVVAVVVGALALWKLKIVIAVLFLALIIAAAMRPGVEALRRRHVPRGIGIMLHYLALVGLVALLLYFVVPAAADQISRAVPTSSTELEEATQTSGGVKQEFLLAVQERLQELPSREQLAERAFDPAVEVTMTAFEVMVGIFFTLASAAYWIFERDRAVNLVTSLVARPRRKKVRDTWDLIDAKLGAYVRGQLLLIVLVASVLSVSFWAIGLPFWLLIAIFAGVVELIPVIGPLTAGALAVGVGLTHSLQVGVAAGLIVLIVRLIEDYLVIPRVLGDAVGLTPLTVLVAVAAVTFLFGGFAVLLAIPLAAILATLIDVLVRDRDPAAEDVPTVLFPAKDVEVQ